MSLLQQINRLAVPANEILNKANQGEGTIGNIINDESLYQQFGCHGRRDETDDGSSFRTTIEAINRGEGTAGQIAQ
jgi:hypothetical protein